MPFLLLQFKSKKKSKKKLPYPIYVWDSYINDTFSTFTQKWQDG